MTRKGGRPTELHPLGKCSEARIDTPVPQEFKTFVSAIATLKGKTLAQYSREAIEAQAVLDAYRMGVKLPPRGGDADGINLPEIAARRGQGGPR